MKICYNIQMKLKISVPLNETRHLTNPNLISYDNSTLVQIIDGVFKV